MSKAVIILKSPRSETYQTVFEQLVAKRPDLIDVVWVFYNTDRNEKLIPADRIPPNARSTVAVASSPEEISRYLNGAASLDVTGLPKEDFAQILPIIVGHRKLKAYTLTRTGEGTDYVDLLSHPTLSAFRRSHLGKLLFFRIALVVIIAGLIGLAVTQLVKTFPNAQVWATWLGVFLGIVGVSLSYFSLRKG